MHREIENRASLQCDFLVNEKEELTVDYTGKRKIYRNLLIIFAVYYFLRK
jgi:hypothetical protein